MDIHTVDTLSFSTQTILSKCILGGKVSCKVDFCMLKFIFLFILSLEQGLSPRKILRDPSPPPTTQSLKAEQLIRLEIAHPTQCRIILYQWGKYFPFLYSFLSHIILRTVHLSQNFSASTLLTFGTKHFFAAGYCSVCFKIFGSLPDLSPLNASTNILSSYDNKISPRHCQNHLWSGASLVSQMVKNLPAVGETWVQSLGWEDSPGEGIGNLLRDSCLKNSMDRGAWWAIAHGVATSWM